MSHLVAYAGNPRYDDYLFLNARKMFCLAVRCERQCERQERVKDTEENVYKPECQIVFAEHL